MVLCVGHAKMVPLPKVIWLCLSQSLWTSSRVFQKILHCGTKLDTASWQYCSIHSPQGRSIRNCKGAAIGSPVGGLGHRCSGSWGIINFVTGPKFMCPMVQKVSIQNIKIWSKKNFYWLRRCSIQTRASLKSILPKSKVQAFLKSREIKNRRGKRWLTTLDMLFCLQSLLYFLLYMGHTEYSCPYFFLSNNYLDCCRLML